MRCKNCGGDELLPVLFGSPDEWAWLAMLQGSVHLAGCVTPEWPQWYCDDCLQEQAVDDADDHRRAVDDAIRIAKVTAHAPYNTMGVAQGRRVARRVIVFGNRAGASEIKIVAEGVDLRVFAKIGDEWNEFEWELAKYLPQMIEAVRHHQVRECVAVGGVRYLVIVSELAEADAGLRFVLSRPI